MIHDVINIPSESLNFQDYELKILIFVGMFVSDNLSCKCTLKTMREWLWLKQNQNNNKKIKEALNGL